MSKEITAHLSPTFMPEEPLFLLYMNQRLSNQTNHVQVQLYCTYWGILTYQMQVRYRQ